MMALDVTSKLMQTPGIFASDIDNEVVMANLETGKYYGLNPVSAYIWKLLQEPKSIRDLCIQLQKKYEVDEETCLQDVTILIRRLIEARLVQPA